MTDWIFRLSACEYDHWCAPLPHDLDGEDADVELVEVARKVAMYILDAIHMMEAIPVFVAGLLDWGFNLDNPVNTPEVEALKKCLVVSCSGLRSRRRGGTQRICNDI